jgi:hypothetical protein
MQQSEVVLITAIEKAGESFKKIVGSLVKDRGLNNLCSHPACLTIERTRCLPYKNFRLFTGYSTFIPKPQAAICQTSRL